VKLGPTGHNAAPRSPEASAGGCARSADVRRFTTHTYRGFNCAVLNLNRRA
jgi:hypothetical protein